MTNDGSQQARRSVDIRNDVTIAADTVRDGGNVTGVSFGMVTADVVHIHEAPRPAVNLTPLERRNRQMMLDKVAQFWVRGVLDQSLYREARMALGLASTPGAVVNPWQTVLQQPGQQDQLLPPDTAITRVFDSMHQSLLILGAPGAGKTSLLLELARDLIARAQQDDAYPMPVVFNLSSWAEKCAPLEDWLIEELFVRYDVPRKLGRQWVEAEQVLPLLDGLDEVALARRDVCVAAINAFREAHGLLAIAVCSRATDYAALSTKLRLAAAVVVQPLTVAQVDQVLAAGGEVLATLQTALVEDEGLRELAETPLMLSVMTLAYQATAESITQGGTREEQRARIFDAYINAMLQRRGALRYRRDQTRRWLTWLARQMQQRAQSLFLIEGLQPEWLPDRAARMRYWLIDRLGWSILIALLGGLGGILVGAWLLDLVTPRLAGVLGAAMGFLTVGIFGSRASEVAPEQRVVQVLDGLRGYVAVAVGMGCAYMWLGPGTTFVSAIGAGLIGGIPGALLGVVTGRPGTGPRGIAPVERLHWSWARMARSAVNGLVLGAGGGLGLGLVTLLGSATLRAYAGTRSVLLGQALLQQIGGVWGFGLLGGLAGAIIIGIVGGLQTGHMPASAMPNQGIRRSLVNAALAGISIGLASAVVGAALFGLGYTVLNDIGSPGRGVLGGVIFGVLAGGLLGALAYGGYAVLSHLALRVVLWRGGLVPWNLAAFLDYATERVFLRKVGGGYIFIHRLLLEHLADSNTREHQT